MAIPEARMRTLLEPYIGKTMPGLEVLQTIDRYLDLILLWNSRTNLTAVRDPEVLLQRQIGESLFSAQFVPATGTLLDFGSGAGLPGIPIAILRPGMCITLAESQGKKASFLREAGRSLNLTTTVWASRVETMPATTTFDCVAMRAVDDSARMVPVALDRVAADGTLLRFLGENIDPGVDGWAEVSNIAIPHSRGTVQVLRRN